ncbi:Vacuolar protein sorting-associated protein atg6 [Oleoguttula sp. CCFEE 5521]
MKRHIESGKPPEDLALKKCRSPLKVDDSLNDLNPASFKILADAATLLEPKAPDAPRSAAAKERRRQYDEVSREAGSPIHKRQTAAEKHTADKLRPDMSYIMLTESQLAPEGPGEVIPTPAKGKPSGKKTSVEVTCGKSVLTAQKLEQTMRLFEILSARSDIDHPICTECTELVLDGLHKRQLAVTRERDAYVQFLKSAQDDVPTDEEKAKTKKALDDAKQRERQALAELEALEAEKAKMEEEIAALDAEADDLDDEEEQFWRERNAFAAELTAAKEERDSLHNRLAHDTKVLEALQRTNVYNDTFSISHDGLFGTINGLRLGRLPDHPVDWAEINAAWGQALLLLVVVVEKLGVTLTGWKLHPIGSTSKIEKTSQSSSSSSSDKPAGTTFDLFTAGDVPLSFGLLHRSFDSSMVAFLDCVRQVGEHVELSPGTKPGAAGPNLPYKIAKDKIGEVSIKLGNFGQEEQWTRACKYTLTCCKFLLAHASHVDSSSDSKIAR